MQLDGGFMGGNGGYGGAYSWSSPNSTVQYPPSIMGGNNGYGMTVPTSMPYGSGQGLGAAIAMPQLIKEGLLPGVLQGQQMIGNSMPNAGGFVQQGIGYGNQASNAYAANQAQQMGQYMPQYTAAYNQAYGSGQAAQQQAYNTALGQAPGMSGMLNDRNTLLAQQTQEATGQAPQYLQDYWKQQAGSQLQNTMGAFGGSQLGSGALANMMAANLYQYHTGAEQNLGNTINNWNPYMNQVGQNNTANTLASAYAPNSANAWQGGYGMGQQAYQNASAPMQNTSKWFTS